MTDCVHRGKVSAIRKGFELRACEAQGKLCVPTAADLALLPTVPAVSCEGCPHYEAAQTPSEQRFRGLPWGQGESVSGPGSSMASTAGIREKLPQLLRELGCRSLLDLPCGDFHWMQAVDLQGIRYIGADCVRDLVAANGRRFPDRLFMHLDITLDHLPYVDVIFSRDCLVHLPYQMVRQALARIVDSGATWLITTNFPGRVNHDIELGHWRPLDLTAAPFWLPPPEHVISEGCTEGGGAYADKSLGVWRIESIRAAVQRMTSGPRLTIGLPYYRDWPGLWATVESLYLHHADAMRDCELIVVDNDPTGDPDAASEANHSWKARTLCEQVGARYERFTDVSGTAAAKGRIFDLASAPAVLVMDCHVLLPPGVLGRLVEWFAANPQSRDLIQGPLTAAGQILGTHLSPRWGSLMFGQWATDHVRAKGDEPWEIPAQGCGLFAMNVAAWPGFHPLLRGFGPEEYHLHGRVRAAGGRCLCVPWLRWSHRFGNPDGHKPPGMRPVDRLRGHLITSMDCGDPSVESIRHHFIEEEKAVTARVFARCLEQTEREYNATAKGPTWIVKGWNLTRAVMRWITHGAPVCTPEQIEQRLTICQSCPHLINDACSLCGCPVNGRGKLIDKLSMATESCYAKPPKWGPVSDDV